MIYVKRRTETVVANLKSVWKH